MTTMPTIKPNPMPTASQKESFTFSLQANISNRMVMMAKATISLMKIPILA